MVISRLPTGALAQAAVGQRVVFTGCYRIGNKASPSAAHPSPTHPGSAALAAIPAQRCFRASEAAAAARRVPGARLCVPKSVIPPRLLNL